MGHYENQFKQHVALPWGWDPSRHAGSFGDFDLKLTRPEPLRKHDFPIELPAEVANLRAARVHVAECKARQGPKLSLTDANREVWEDVQTLKEYALDKDYEAYIWFRPKGVHDLRGLDEHEKWFGFDATTIDNWDVGPLHYTEGEPSIEVLR